MRPLRLLLTRSRSAAARADRAARAVPACARAAVDRFGHQEPVRDRGCARQHPHPVRLARAAAAVAARALRAVLPLTGLLSLLLPLCARSPDGQKKAYVRLSPDVEALEVANRIGII